MEQTQSRACLGGTAVARAGGSPKSGSYAVAIEGFQRARGVAKFDLESFQMAGLGRRVLIHGRDGGAQQGRGVRPLGLGKQQGYCVRRQKNRRRARAGPGTTVHGVTSQEQLTSHSRAGAGPCGDVQLDTTVRYSKAMNRLGIAESY